MQKNGLKKAIRENRVSIGTDLSEFATRGIPKDLATHKPNTPKSPGPVI